VVSVVSLSAQERDPRIGTWKLNVAQSTYDPGPPPQSVTRTYEDRGGGVTLFTVEGINAQGNPIFVQVAHKLDGKDYPVTGIPYADAVSVKRIDANTIEATMKKGGQLTMTVITKLSKDGKTRTSTFKGKDAEGHDVHNVVVSDKQ